MKICGKITYGMYFWRKQMKGKKSLSFLGPKIWSKIHPSLENGINKNNLLIIKNQVYLFFLYRCNENNFFIICVKVL